MRDIGHRVLLLALCARGLAGCSAPRDERAATEPPAVTASVGSRVAEHESSRAPLEASWVVVAASDTRTVLRARVARHGAWTLPTTLTVTLPQGAHLARGTTSVSLPPTHVKPTVEYELELLHARPPADDAMLSVDGEDLTLGVHARVPYRFGRAEPVAVRPEAVGVALTLAGRRFGRVVPVTQPLHASNLAP